MYNSQHKKEVNLQWQLLINYFILNSYLNITNKRITCIETNELIHNAVVLKLLKIPNAQEQLLGCSCAFNYSKVTTLMVHLKISILGFVLTTLCYGQFQTVEKGILYIYPSTHYQIPGCQYPSG